MTLSRLNRINFIKEKNKMVNQITLIIILLFIFVPSPIYAYMDPGTWSYLFSIIIAFSAGTLYYAKSFLGKIKEIFNKIFKKNNN